MDVRLFIKRQSFSGLIGYGVLWNLKVYSLSEETLYWTPFAVSSMQPSK